MTVLGFLMAYAYEITAVLLFVIGLMNLLLRRNLLMKSLGFNLLSTGIFLLFGARGYLSGGQPALLDPVTGTGPETMVNPIPSGLILTGIVVSVSMTALFLALCVRIHEAYGTLELDDILHKQGEEAAGTPPEDEGKAQEGGGKP